MKYEKYAKIDLKFLDNDFNNSKIEELALKIDNKIKKIKLKPFLYQESVLNEYEKNISPIIKQIEYIIQKQLKDLYSKELLQEIFNELKFNIKYDLSMNNFKYGYIKRKTYKKEVKELSQNGMCILNIEKKLTKKLYQEFRTNYYNEMSDEVKKTNSRVVRTISNTCSLGKELTSYIKELNLESILSDYMQLDIFYGASGLELSNNKQKWHTNSKIKTEYMHFDADSYCPKGLWYLNRMLKENDGATQYVPKSHNWYKPPFMFNFSKSLDKVLSKRFKKVFNTNYYFEHLSNKQMKPILKNIPSSLIYSTHFGGGVKEQIAKKILEKKISYLSNRDSIILFDGGNGIHRGAMTKNKDRYALQMCFYPLIQKQAINTISKSSLEIEKIATYEKKLLSNINTIPFSSNIVLYGLGNGGINIYNIYNKKKNIIAIVDREKNGQMFENFKVSSIEDYSFSSKDIIVITIINENITPKIITQLKNKNINFKIVSYLSC